MTQLLANPTCLLNETSTKPPSNRELLDWWMHEGAEKVAQSESALKLHHPFPCLMCLFHLVPPDYILYDKPVIISAFLSSMSCPSNFSSFLARGYMHLPERETGWRRSSEKAPSWEIVMPQSLLLSLSLLLRFWVCTCMWPASFPSYHVQNLNHMVGHVECSCLNHKATEPILLQRIIKPE